MDNPTTQTPADIALADRAGRIAGLPISPGQIRRWRKVGLLPMLRIGLGRGKGWRFEYPEGSAEFAAAIARELPRRRTLDLAACAAFARGTSPTHVDVLVRLCEPWKKALNSVADDPGQAALHLASKATVRASTYPLISSVKQIVGRPSVLAELIRGGFDFVLAGREAGLARALNALGVSSETSQEMAEAFPADFGSLEKMLKMSVVFEADVRAATLEDFKRARDDAMAVSRAAKGWIVQLGALVGMPQQDAGEDEVEDEVMAIVVVMLYLRKKYGDNLDALIAFLQHPEALLEQIVGSLQGWAGANPADTGVLAPIGQAILEATFGK